MATYVAAVQGTHAGSTVINTFHISGPSGLEQDLANGWASGVHAAYLDCLNAGYESVGITVTDIDAKTQGFASLVGNGTIIGDSLPPYCAAVITWKTTQVGRRYRGRSYIPAQSEGQQDHGVIVPAMVTLLDNLAAEIRSWPPTAGATSLVIYHRDSHAVSLVSAYKIRTVLHVQRRRTLNYGV